MIRITELDGGALVYEGEGELILGPGPDRPTNLLADGVAIRQEQRQEDGEIRVRQIDISGLLEGVRAEYRINYAPSTVVWEQDRDPLRIPDPPRVRLYELRAEFPMSMGAWLRSVLERSFETPQERRTREEAWSEALRSADGYGIVPRAEITFDDIRDGLRRHRRPEPTMAEALAQVAESARRAGEGLSSLAEAFQRNEEAITSTRAEFPHDPLQYGRIYPGDAGASRWTPPADPDEKIRSCP
jgi:hypothetical protein